MKKVFLFLIFISCAKEEMKPVEREKDVQGSENSVPQEKYQFETRCLSTSSGPMVIAWKFNTEENLSFERRSYFSDNTCSQLDFSIKFTFEFRQVEKQVFSVDFTYEKIELTPSTERVVSDLNRGTFCNISDWEINKGTEITGLNCGNEAWPERGDVYQQIMKLTDEYMLLGEFLADRSTRPINLNEDLKYYRTVD